MTPPPPYGHYPPPHYTFKRKGLTGAHVAMIVLGGIVGIVLLVVFACCVLLPAVSVFNDPNGDPSTDPSIGQQIGITG